jgi:hypothetical protein
MIRTYFIIRLSILLIFAGIIAGGVSNGKWLSVGPAEAGNSNPLSMEGQGMKYLCRPASRSRVISGF